MRIRILGSWRTDDKEGWQFRASHADFAKACHVLGKELARNRQVVIVGGGSEITADVHVVKGILEVAGGGDVPYPLIEVLRPKDDKLPYEDQARVHPNLFLFHPKTQVSWNAARLVSIREADAVLTIGGSGGTHTAGLAAIVARKTLVPLASFGGASAQLLQALLDDLKTRGQDKNVPECRLSN